MSLIEFIGFVITFMALSILFGKKAKEEKRRKRDPEGYEREQQAKREALEKMYGVILDGPPKRVKEEEEPYEEEVVVPPHPPSLKAVQAPPQRRKLNKKQMVILATIFGPPKTLEKGTL